ncbi:hypothetical protein [Christiangramia forsetii]|uniref:Uncharacterized protein n=1 Tax=Christiangramia forsetii TaxID=411153 RepID=A0ABQ1WNM7_9FLAO|nr:hypothetical protein [Christiangramia forsetii]GGG38051.1 hypothetical protein GCM10011532_22190 [Christiangramia forsetii]
MKKVHLFLFVIIFLSIIAKVSLRSDNELKYTALSIDTKAEQVDYFFEYKVNHLQFDSTYKSMNCEIKSPVCCHV